MAFTEFISNKMTPGIPVLIIGTMTLCSFGGGVSLGKFNETRDVLWLVAGYSLYSLSNILFVLLIDQSGLARALVVGTAAHILLTLLAAHFVFGEPIGVKGAMAAGLVILAAALNASAASSDITSPTSKESQSE